MLYDLILHKFNWAISINQMHKVSIKLRISEIL
jgi:hypothetical protein